jgi:osmotically-inducible protein OsmY
MAERWEHDGGYRDRERHERAVSDRAGDEVRSWFGDDEAARRRRMDEMREHRYDRDWHDRPRHAAERAWEGARDTARDVTDRDRDGRRGLSEWNDYDRPGPYTKPSYRSGSTWSGTMGGDRDDYWTGDRGYRDTMRSGSSTPSPYAVHGVSFAGRGPRGYQRTEARIHEDVCERLTDDHRIDASDIEVHIKDGELTLTGSVRTREEKRYAEDLVERVTGVREVNNHLKVKPATEVLGTARSGSSVLGLTDTPPPTGRNH